MNRAARMAGAAQKKPRVSKEVLNAHIHLHYPITL